MNLKTKICSIVAAALLSIGLIGGTALADTNTTTTVSITLNGGTTTCSASAGALSFGTYNWLNNAYQQDASDKGSLTFTVSVNEAFQATGDTCDVTAYLGAMSSISGGNYNFITIPIGLTSQNTVVGAETFNSPAALATTDNQGNPPATPTTLGTHLPNGGQFSWLPANLAMQLTQQKQPTGTYTGTLYLSGTVTAVTP